MLDERDDVANNGIIEKVDNVQIGDMVVDRVGLDVASALVTLKQNLKQIPIAATPCMQRNPTKGNMIFACLKVSLIHFRFVLPFCLDV